MVYGGTRAPALLFVGDLVVFYLSLWLTLGIRNLRLPELTAFEDHLVPFTALFAVWVLVYYVIGLYGKRTVLLKSRQPQVLVRAQVANIVIAALFFFVVPGIGIAPKTNLAIYLVVSVLLIFLWRLAVYPRISHPRTRIPALLIADGPDAAQVIEEVNAHPRYPFEFRAALSPQAFAALSPEARTAGMPRGVGVVIADMGACDTEGLLPILYDLPGGVGQYELIDFADLYEELFDRVPLSLVQQGWFLQHAVQDDALWYTIPKRIIDVVGAIGMGLATLVLLPFVWLALRTEGPGPLFISQRRIGKFGARVTVYKFRTMQRVDDGAWQGETENRVTRVGAWLRQVSLDEFPQFWNILKGELSLIGPRSDIETLGERLEGALPYYMMRYSVPPGITGWAQVVQEYAPGNLSPQSIEESRTRLAYDFYYVKHRSLGLDLVIALKTLKRMFFRLAQW